MVFDGQKLWVSCPQTGEVVSIDPQQTPLNTTVDRIHVGGEPGSLEFDGTYVWAADRRELLNPLVTRLQKRNVVDTLQIPREGAIQKLRFDGVSMWVLGRAPFSDIGLVSWLAKF